MSGTIEDANGNVVFSEPAGGWGGGITGAATRPAHTHERRAHHAAKVTEAQAALDAAKAAQDAHEASLAEPEPEPEPEPTPTPTPTPYEPTPAPEA